MKVETFFIQYQNNFFLTIAAKCKQLIRHYILDASVAKDRRIPALFSHFNIPCNLLKMTKVRSVLRSV